MTAPVARAAFVPATNPFTRLKHFFGSAAMALISLVDSGAKEIDVVEPQIVQLLQEGASIASIIPGIPPQVAPLLNAGIQLLGDVKASVDGTDAVLAQAETQAQALAPQGYNFVLIKQDVKQDISTLLAPYAQLYSDTKTVVSANHPPASPTIPAVPVVAPTSAGQSV